MKKMAHGGASYAEGGEVDGEKEESMTPLHKGILHPKHMAKMIMMAKGGLIDSEAALKEGGDTEDHEEPDFGEDENELMPIDMEDEDEAFSDEDGENETATMKPKKDLITRIMMKRR